jgi:Na+-transporting methylmalonyl-CoA/oxaloacetate decarboxylase gamma subunit
MKAIRPDIDEDSRGVGVVLALLGALALFSFVMAGLVGEHERTARAAAQGSSIAAHVFVHRAG